MNQKNKKIGSTEKICAAFVLIFFIKFCLIPVCTKEQSSDPFRGTTHAISLGDYKYYNIGDRGARSFKQLNELFAGNGMIGMVAKERVDGKLVLPEAVQILKLKAETQAAKA